MMICTTEKMRNTIAELVRKFGDEQMGIRPKKVSVDIHEASVTITLEGVSHPAEMRLAGDPPSRAMIEKMYLELFKISKPILHSRLETLLGRIVDRSFFAVEPQFGSAVIVLFLTRALEQPGNNEYLK